MREFEQRNKVRKARRILYSTPMLILMVCILGFAVVKVYNIAVKARNSGLMLVGTLEEYEKMQVREEYLQGSIESLNTQEGVEAKIREEFGYVKDGEEMIVVIDDKNKPNEKEEQEAEPKFLERIFGWW